MLSFLKKYKLETALGPAFKLLEALFELFIPIVVANIIDIGIANGDKPYIFKMSLIMAVLGLIGLVCAISAQYFAAKASVGYATELRSTLFKKVQSLTYSGIDELGTSTAINRLTSDVNQLQTGINLVLRLFLRSPFIVFGAMIMAFTIDAESTLIFAAVILVLSIIVFGIMLINIPLFKKVQSRLDEVLLSARENLNGARVIRAFGKEEAETENFKERTEALSKIQLFAGRISALMNPLTYVVVNAGIIAIIQHGALKVESGALTQGQVVALVNYMSQILVELVKLASLIITITKSIASGKRVKALLDLDTNVEIIKTDIKETDTYIKFDNVSLRYAGASENSLDNISFVANKGDTIGVIGGTGSGKSSIINLLPRFYDVTNGTVYFDGKDVRSFDTEELRTKIALVPQKAVLFKGTIRSNLLWGNANATDEELWGALRLAQAEEFVRGKDGGLDATVEQNGRNFSGGQKQRLTIARALVARPEVLILDDSASALDYATESKLRSAIKNLDYSPTVFIVSQRASSIKHADRILVVDDGDLVGSGTHDELLKSCETYQEIYYSQFEKEVDA